MSEAAGPQLGRVGPAQLGLAQGTLAGTSALFRPGSVLVLQGLWMQAGSLGPHSQGLRGSKRVMQAPHQFSGLPCGSLARPQGPHSM